MRAAAVLLFILPGAHGFAQEARPVTAEFRIFAAAEEITATTRLRIMPSGERDKASVITGGKTLVAEVPPGIYDVQALRLRQEGIIAIRWAERLVVMHYPDEAGRHLEVINFVEGYGALQIRTAHGSLEGYDITVFPAGERTAAAGEAVEGEGYRLFVVKAGTYDVRIRTAGRSDDAGAYWFPGVEVPADRTRLKQIDSR